jgi:acetyl esterase/lipase
LETDREGLRYPEPMPPALMDLAPADAEARLAYGPHPSQFVDFRRPEGRGPHPLVVMIHGGFWRQRRTLTYAGHLCIALGQAGFATANIEYRRTGEEGGGWPGTFHDVTSAIRFARSRAPEFSGDPARTVLLGHSAGGHLALLAAAEFADLTGAVSLAGVVNLRAAWDLRLGDDVVTEFMGGIPDTLIGAYLAADPVNRAACCPVVLIHGTADDIVPHSLSRDFPQSKRYVELAGADHFALIDPDSREWPVVLQQLTALTQA